MKKALALVIMAMMILGMTACTSGNDAEVETSSEEAPTYTQEQLLDEVDFNEAQYITAEDGEVTVSPDETLGAAGAEGQAAPALRSDLPPDEVWESDSNYDFDSSDFTLPEDVQMEDGSLGTLSIPKIGLTVGIYETDDEMEDMAHGVAHFKETTCWDGNVGLAGHNQGVNTYFGQIHTLVPGDEITLKTALGTRTYEVTESVEIDETDWSYLERTEDNRITLITCVNHDLTKRLCVQAVEK